MPKLEITYGIEARYTTYRRELDTFYIFVCGVEAPVKMSEAIEKEFKVKALILEDMKVERLWKEEIQAQNQYDEIQVRRYLEAS